MSYFKFDLKSVDLVKKWFQIWESGEFHSLPITNNFKHTSPYGIIDGKKAYLDLVESNKDKFLGHKFIIHDIIGHENKTCVRYTAIQNDFRLKVSEWHFIENDLITEVIAYYNIEGEISEERKLKNLT